MNQNAARQAVDNMDISALRELLETGTVDPNATDPFGETLLHRALENKWGEPPFELTQTIVQILLEYGANPTIPNRNGVRPLDMTPYDTLVELMEQYIPRRRTANMHRIRYINTRYRTQ